MGFNVGPVRMPLLDMEGIDKENLKAIMSAMDLLDIVI